MSRIGNKPIPIPPGVQVEITPGEVVARGPQGELRQAFPPTINVAIENDNIVVTRPSDQRNYRALHGLTRSLVANAVEGVSQGFRKGLEIVGVGYRAQKVGDKLVFQLGYSHPVEVVPPPGISFAVDATTRFAVIGIDKQQVGQVAADIRRLRSPEPYKGKGIRYAGEVVRRKAGKSSRAGGKKR